MWHLEVSKRADKQLSKMDASTRRIIVAWLLKNIEGCENPRVHGKALSANRAGQWRYRVGNYRILCEIKDETLVVLALEIGHRKTIYK